MDQDSLEFQRNLERFFCLRCGECCRKPGFVYLTSDEAAAAAVYLNLSEFEFINSYCDLQDRRKLVLKKNGDESCVFLKGNECQIHAVKPAQCMDFPKKWRTPASFDYCAGLKKVFH